MGEGVREGGGPGGGGGRRCEKFLFGDRKVGMWKGGSEGGRGQGGVDGGWRKQTSGVCEVEAGCCPSRVSQEDGRDRAARIAVMPSRPD